MPDVILCACTVIMSFVGMSSFVGTSIVVGISIQDILDTGNAICRWDARGQSRFKACLQVNLVVLREELIAADVLDPIYDLVDERNLHIELFSNPLGNENAIGNVIREEARMNGQHVGAVVQLLSRSLDPTQLLRILERSQGVIVGGFVSQPLEGKIIEHVLEGAIWKVLADGIANGCVIVIEALHTIGRQLIKVLVEEWHLVICLPLPAVALPQAVAATGMNNLVVNAQGQRDEGAGLDKLTGSELLVADIVQEDILETVELFVRSNGSDVDLLAAIIVAETSILFSAADPGDETDGEGDGIAQAEFLFHLMHHPVETGLAKDGTDKDFLLGLVNVGSETKESISVLVNRHAEHDDVCVRNDVGRIRALLLDLAMV